MAKKLKGIVIEIGGNTTALDKALKKVNDNTKSLQSELRGVESLLKFDPTNTELLAQKQTILTEAIGETSEKLEILKDVEEQVAQKFAAGEIAADQWRDFQREIIVTEQKLEGLKDEFEGVGDSADTSEAVSEYEKLTKKIEDQETELTQLRDEYTNVILEQGEASSEAADLRSKIQSLNDELKDNKSTLSDAEGAANDLADALKDVDTEAGNTEGGFTIMGGALADLVSTAIQNAITAVGDFIGSLMELDEATEEYRTMQAKLEGSAETFGYSTDFANSKYQEFYKYLGDDQAATNAITNLMGLGTSTENISDLANAAIGVWSAYGDSIPIEGLTEAINETAQVGVVTGSLADALNWAGISEEDFNKELSKCPTVLGRVNLLASTLNDTYGESKERYDELSGSVLDANEAELDLKETQAELGETVAPINTALTNLKNQALQAITPLVQRLADGFMNLYNWMQENPVAMAILTGVAIGLATAFTVLAGALAIQGIITGVTKAFGFLKTTLLANPITLIVAAIAGLVAAFIYLWNNCEGFRQFWLNLWENIKSLFSSFVSYLSGKFEVVKGFFSALWVKIQAIWSAIMSSLQPLFDAITGAFSEGWELIKLIWSVVEPFFSGIWEAIKAVFSVVQTVLSMFFQNAWINIQLIWSVAVSYFQTIWNNIVAVFSVVKTFFAGMFRTAWVAIKAVWNGVVGYFAAIWNTIKGIFSVVRNVLSGNFRGAWNAIKGIVGTWVGYFRSIWSSIKAVFSSVGSWFGNTFRAAWSAVKQAFSNWTSFFSGLWNKIKNAFSKIGTNIADAISDSVKSGLNGVIASIEGIINTGIGLINGAIGVINAIPGVDIGTISELSLPRLAKGGIVDNPTVAMIGEAGREAVIPLENNTGWLDEIARRLNAFESQTALNTNGAILAKLDGIYERLSRLQVVLSSGTLVGEIIDLIDAELADKQLLATRSV